MIAVGIVNLACDAIARCCGLSRAHVLASAALDEPLLLQPDAMLDAACFVRLLRFARAHTRDAGLGLRLARLVDLREQGFWGYAVLSSSSLRERIEAHLRYQTLRAPWKLALREERGVASLELIPLELPEDVLPIVIDWIMATALLHLGAHVGRKPQGFEVRLAYPARAHHRALAELFEGELVFDAAVSCVRVPVALLDLPLPGDPQLGRLVRGQLDAQLETLHACEPSGLVEQVRERVAARIDQDACLVMVARDLRLSARTLQRQLEAAATSFNELLEDVRRAHAMRYVAQTEHSVLQIAGSLGYADASSFRRAFRRWTGVSPTRFRATTRAFAAVARDVSKAARKVSVA